MTLEEIYYISQIVAVIAILGSLVAIYFQMRQNHAQELANAQRDILNQSRDWWMLGVENEEMFKTICAGLQDFNGLTPFQQARFHAWAANLQQIVTGVHFQHRSKLINPSSHEGFMRAYLSILNTPGGRAWWGISGKIGNQELTTYLNKRLAAEAATLPLWTDIVPHFRLPPAPSEAAKPKDLA
jgi:hypothetical protein